MNRFFTEPIIISRKQSAEFLDSLANPDREYIHNRDAVFSEMDNAINIQKNGTDMEVDIQSLDLSFIDEMHDENGMDVLTVNVRLEKTDWCQFIFCNMSDVNSSVYSNMKEDSVMHEAMDSKQLQMAA